MRHCGLLKLVGTMLLVAGAVVDAAAQSGDWISHTPFRSVRWMASSDSDVWAATSGGVFSYNTASGEIRTFTTTNGLYGIDAVTVDYDDRRDAIWIGYGDGVLDRIDVEAATVRTFLDIARADQFASRGINRLEVIGDTIWVSTEFGVVLFDPIDLEVIDSYSNFGELNPATPANDVLLSPLPDGRRGIWVATEAGLVKADLDAVNLREPSEWSQEVDVPVFRSLSLEEFNGRVVVGTESDAFARNSDGTWVQLNLAGREIPTLEVWQNELVALESFSVVFLSQSGVRRRIFVGFQSGSTQIPYAAPRALTEGPTGQLWVGDGVEGVLGVPGIESAQERHWSDLAIVPEGPFAGLFTDLVFDLDGSLWASGTRGTGSGFHKFDGEVWTAYTSRFVPELEERAGYDFIHASGTGSVWAGSEGWGMAEVRPDGAVVVYDETNSSLQAAPGTDRFTRVRGSASESDGGLWTINQFAATPLNYLATDGSWSGTPPLRGDGIPSSLDYDKLFVDAFGQKWILPNRGNGMIVWDTRETPLDRSDDALKYLRGQGSGGRGLPNETVTAWVEDRAGRVWIGTERGLGIYFVPSLVISDDPNAFEAVWPIAEDRSGFLLRDVNANDMAVDAADRKWIASTTGAWLIDSEGTVVLKHFTSENSPLFSDEVVSVAVDNRSGKVYFATDLGLLSYQDDPIEPVTEAEDLFIFPNPAVASADGSLPEISIQGLVAETDIRIAKADGAVVAAIEGKGGRVRWDGRDFNGEYVPSGVYIVMARGLNDEGTAYGKLAVVR